MIHTPKNIKSTRSQRMQDLRWPPVAYYAGVGRRYPTCLLGPHLPAPAKGALMQVIYKKQT